MDAPLEALAFFAVVNNLWTWIAAVVTFWRIRVTTININDGFNLLEGLTEPESITGSVEETVAQVKKVVTKTDVWEPLMCTEDGVTKGKLTRYYEVDVNVVNGRECDDGEITDVNYGMDDCGEWWEKWEKVMKMRNGDDSWYRYVDLTVVNGNVVRLWEDNRVCNGAR